MQRAFFFVLMVLFAALLPIPALAKDHTKIKVVITGPNGKPVERADVIVRFGGRSLVKLGRKDITQWEMRSTQEGVADIPEMPKGTIRIQVLAKGLQSFGQTFEIMEDERTIQIALQAPQKQYSAHEQQ